MKIIKKNQHILFPILDITLNGVNYLFHIFVSWYLIPMEYGKLNSLLAIVSILLVCGISFQIYTSKKVAEGKHGEIFGILKAAGYLTIMISVIFVGGFFIIEKITRGGFLSHIIILLIFILNILLSVYRGIFQGTREFFNLNINFYIEVLTKTIVILILLPKFSTRETVLFTILIGMIAALIHGFIVSRDTFFKKNEKTASNIREILKQLIIIFIGNFFIYYFTNVDMIAVNYFIPKESGVFAVVIRYSQIMMFATLSIITVFIPTLSKVKSDRKEFRKKVLLLFSLVTIIGVTLILAYKFFVPPTVDWFFGIQYSEAKEYLVLGAVAYFMLVLSFILINVCIVLERTTYLWILSCFAVITLVLFSIFNSSIKQIFFVEIASYSAMLCFLIIWYLRKEKIYD